MKICYNQLFIGNVNICTKYENHFLYRNESDFGNSGFGYTDVESELYKENVILVKITDGAYVELDRINTFFDELKIKFSFTKDGWTKLTKEGIVLAQSPSYLGYKFVDEKSLRPYFRQNSKHKVSHKVLKRTILK